ncbi:hypothetical protein LCGC14_1099880 [marine sediment metagenome]|uniref:Uncharacterized protein n=1 Tax=marine sediment metagenome TaxID=412755 RepID=A0A0F9PSX7_9ZZZZ
MNETDKLIILVAIYRAQVKFLLDNFVSTDNVPTKFWMELMDKYAAKQAKSEDNME